MTATGWLQGQAQPVPRAETLHKEQEEKFGHQADFGSCSVGHTSPQLAWDSLCIQGLGEGLRAREGKVQLEVVKPSHGLGQVNETGTESIGTQP